MIYQVPITAQSLPLQERQTKYIHNTQDVCNIFFSTVRGHSGLSVEAVEW